MTKLTRSADTLSLALEVSPRPVSLCGPGPDAPVECWPMYRPPSSRYHAYTVIAVPRALAAHVRRLVVTQETYEPEILVPVPRGVVP